MTADDLTLLEQLHSAAALGPWSWRIDSEDVVVVTSPTGVVADVWDDRPPAVPPGPPDEQSLDRAKATAEFIAAAHRLVPELIDEIRQLRELLDDLLDDGPPRLLHLNVDVLNPAALYRPVETLTTAGGVL